MPKKSHDMQRGLLYLRACLNELDWHRIAVEKAIIASDVPTVLLSEPPAALLRDTTPTEQDDYLFIQFMHCRVCWRNPAAE